LEIHRNQPRYLLTDVNAGKNFKLQSPEEVLEKIKP
jgi:hypothetical protein